ncbi:MAG: hypothetical protein AB7F35_30715 [Acetobacteraceae bacterium]
MTHCIARFYSGTAAADITSIVALARSELIPAIAKLPGLRRYSVLTLNDGRIGSFSVWGSRQAADHGGEVAGAWVRSKPDLAKYPLDLTLRGEVGLAVTGTGSTGSEARPGHAVARLYRTDKSLAEVDAAIEQEGLAAIRAIPGLLRYTTAKLDDGRIASFNAFESESAARASVEKARELRQRSGSRLSHVLPDDPEVLEGSLLLTHSK